MTTYTDKPMELNDAISRLLKSGVVKVTFGQRQDGQMQCSADQVLNDGAQVFVHHAADVTAEECWKKVVRSVEHCGNLQAVIVPLMPTGKGKLN